MCLLSTASSLSIVDLSGDKIPRAKKLTDYRELPNQFKTNTYFVLVSYGLLQLNNADLLYSKP